MEPGWYLEDVEGADVAENASTDKDFGNMVQEEKPDRDQFETDSYDKYIGAELIVDRGDGDKQRGRVSKRAKGKNGEFVGRSHTNPLMDTREYKFPDGDTERYAANVIAENLYSQVDEEGRQFALIKEIIDHATDTTAITKVDGFVVSKNGNKYRRSQLEDEILCVELNDRTLDWVALKDRKESNPVKVAENAVMNSLAEEPAFKWWIADVLRIRNRIVAKVKSKYWRTTHKFGIRLPTSVDDAFRIDEQNGNRVWQGRYAERYRKSVSCVD